MSDGTYPTRRRAEATTTAAVVGASAAATLGLGAYTGSIVALVAATVGVIVALYELLAIRTDDFPTITEIVKGGGWAARVAFAALGSLVFVDHFVTGLVL